MLLHDVRRGSFAPAVFPVAAPLSDTDRIAEVDLVRGAALLGVVWMNLIENTTWLVPQNVRDALPSAPLDRVATGFSDWLVSGKAQTLFGILFGFGFAVFIDRASARRADATVLYLRRLSFLLLFGILQYAFLWWGDILHDYAAVGFLLLFSRRWSDRSLLLVGCSLAVCAWPCWDALMKAVVPAAFHGKVLARTAFNQAMWQALSTGDYRQMVHAVWFRTVGLYGAGGVIGYGATLFGQFLIGSWVFRKGWLRNASEHRVPFARGAILFFPIGVALAAISPFRGSLGLPHGVVLDLLVRILDHAASLLLAVGYACMLTLAATSPAFRAAASGLSSFGRMALTGYVSQSLFYFLVIDGYGLGLLGRTGTAVDVVLALAVGTAQILFARWWLARYRFGPLEWLWRSVTYRRSQPMRRHP